MSYSQFDSAFSGGGFVSTQATQSTEFSPSVSKNRDSQGLFPLTVKQMSQASDSTDGKAGFTVDGVDVSNITMVGIVTGKVERETDVIFTVDDGTGHIECRRWKNDISDSREAEQIQEGMYVRVHGHLKGFQGKKELNAFSIRSVTNFNEIAFHFIECVYVHMYNIKFSVPEGKKSIGEFVLQYLSQPTVNEGPGIHIDELARELNVPKETIKIYIATLENEGSVYTTYDEFHYKSALSG